MAAGGQGEGTQDVSPELVRIAATLVQAAAQTGHSGFAQGVVEWLTDRGLGSDEDRRMLAAIVGSAGVPQALRTKVALEEATDPRRQGEATGDESWLPDFETGLGHARAWRLSKALTTFRSIKGVAGTNPALLTNIAVVCEMLARPVEAAEAWLALARLPDLPADDAIEATGRGIALETEANPERSPLVRFANRIAPLAVPAGEEGTAAIELLEDKLRQHPGCEVAHFDRSAWV